MKRKRSRIKRSKSKLRSKKVRGGGKKSNNIKDWLKNKKSSWYTMNLTCLPKYSRREKKMFNKLEDFLNELLEDHELKIDGKIHKVGVINLTLHRSVTYYTIQTYWPSYKTYLHKRSMRWSKLLDFSEAVKWWIERIVKYLNRGNTLEIDINEKSVEPLIKSDNCYERIVHINAYFNQTFFKEKVWENISEPELDSVFGRSYGNGLTLTLESAIFHEGDAFSEEIR